ncbi:ceramide-1-phosphate transfer protein-like [Pristis pectinata]|uniref:ceramide-1-phosphate transfer protein-like n=1 Tax=Pristis pectinata TaxID=685728 RepID=UPI00223DB9FE|nr:ceramide-1-phosphate transfer protein-like [Pristis pectinata]
MGCNSQGCTPANLRMHQRKLQLMNKAKLLGCSGTILRFLPVVVIIIMLLIYLMSFNFSQFQQLNPQESGHESSQRHHHKNKLIAASATVNPVDRISGQQCDNSNFQIHRLQAVFQACVTKDEDISLKSYLEGWTELRKIMNALGTVFGFISEEVTSKMKIIFQHQRGVHGKEYTTMKSMIDYELRNNLVKDSGLRGDGLVSGCHTLLRLHRALQWLQLFLDKLRSNSKSNSMSDMCADAYQRTLAKYHSWLVQKAAGIAFLALPSRAKFLRILCVQDNKETEVKLRNSVNAIERVYNITQRMYAQHGMLELP